MENILELTEPQEMMAPEEQAPVEKPKKSRKKKTERTDIELHEITPQRMTDSEKNKYILFLRKAYEEKEQRMALLDTNCKAAYDKCRFLEQNFANYKNIARAKLQFAKQAISTCHNSIILAGNIEED